MADEFEGAISLVQYSQNLAEGSMERAVVETFVRESDVMAAMMMRPAQGGKYSYMQEEELPGVRFRAYNEPGNVSQGRTSKQTEGVFLMDEYVKVDRALVDEKGPSHRSEQEAMKVKELSRHWTRTFLAGDNVGDPREPDGLKVRSGRANQNVVHNAAGSGGAGLSLAKLDEAINEVRNPTHIIIDRAFKPLLSAAARSSSLTNNIINMDMKDPFGRNVLAFGELPFLFGYPKSRGDSILPFAEVAQGGGSAVTTSLYVVSLSEDGIFMIEGVPIQVKDEGQIPGQPLLSTHIKWDWGLVDKEFAMCRLTSVANAAITA